MEPLSESVNERKYEVVVNEVSLGMMSGKAPSEGYFSLTYWKNLYHQPQQK